MKIDWKSKLSSRKFWALVAGFVGSLLVAFNVSEGSISQVTAIITAFGSMAVYVLAEASVDKATAKNKGEDDSSNEKNK